MNIQERSSGILLPVSALPGSYGIGTFGREAKLFADFLHKAGQKYWQVLPLGPTGFGDSPYQSFSSFAGNPYFIDPDLLYEDGLLDEKDINELKSLYKEERVDYALLYETRPGYLRKAAETGLKGSRDGFDGFCRDNPGVAAYAEFMALKTLNGMKDHLHWQIKTLEAFGERGAHEKEILLYIQYLFFRQWRSLKEYVNSLGISIIGDIPVYVAPDSADVWAEPEQFQLDEDGHPLLVSGVPPDYFSSEGQLWGNPLYDYGHMKKEGYGWWIRRMAAAAALYDVVRIDHFRGFVDYWAVPADAVTAAEGSWREGPGRELAEIFTGWFGDTVFIAEDLGCDMEKVEKVLEECGIPGMKVLEFAFTPDGGSAYLPHKYDRNCVCYTGTHDNAPLSEWLRTADPAELEFAAEYLGLNRDEGYVNGILRGGLSSPAVLFVSQIQDWLGDKENMRMNIPGTPSGNWSWRLLSGEADDVLAERIKELCTRYGR